MGTASEWKSALIWGELWGAFMWFWMARRQDASLALKERIGSMAICAMAGACFGVETTFESRAWHRPLLFVNVGLWLGMFIVWWVFWKKRSSSVPKA